MEKISSVSDGNYFERLGKERREGGKVERRDRRDKTGQETGRGTSGGQSERNIK